MDLGSKNRLTTHSAKLFGSNSLFDEIARAVCKVGVLPRKELYESWQVVQRVSRWVGAEWRAAARAEQPRRVVELCAGHGLAALMLLLRHPNLHALSVELTPPASADKLRAAILARWPELTLRLSVIRGDLARTPLAAGDLALAIHACGSLTDLVIDRAVAAQASVALLPCCHAIAPAAFLGGWLAGPLALDTLRAVRLHGAGYSVTTRTIDARITPQNRLLLARPR